MSSLREIGYVVYKFTSNYLNIKDAAWPFKTFISYTTMFIYFS